MRKAGCAIALTLLLAGTAAAERCDLLSGVGLFLQPAPVLVQPTVVQPAVVMPSAITLQPYMPVTTLRWGFFHRRLVPRTTFVPLAPVTYVPSVAVVQQLQPPQQNQLTAPEK